MSARNAALAAVETATHWFVGMQRAEDFLKTAARLDRFGGGAFDFISVCPPYELVDYVELYDLLEVSPLVRHMQGVGAARGSVHTKVSYKHLIVRCSRHCEGRHGFGVTQYLINMLATLALHTNFLRGPCSALSIYSVSDTLPMLSFFADAFWPLQVKETTMVVMEYPRRLASLVRDSVGPLVKVCLAADAPAYGNMLSCLAYIQERCVPVCNCSVYECMPASDADPRPEVRPHDGRYLWTRSRSRRTLGLVCRLHVQLAHSGAGCWPAVGMLPQMY